MHPLLQALIVPAAGFVVFAVAVAIVRRRIDGPGRSIVVVDRRTYRLAGRRVAEALAAGELARAHAGMTAIRLWLRSEIHTGPSRRRVEYARALEQWEMQAERAGHRGVLGA
ncbi:hypothetical protein ABZS77_29655 [Micromonospora sp. NPDC005298]|uniref:hypothetical protein n=1 Tax=Micromonospora sp. NPDC005298 TaxID=3156873 RepID=UPI0033B6BE9F